MAQTAQNVGVDRVLYFSPATGTVTSANLWLAAGPTLLGPLAATVASNTASWTLTGQTDGYYSAYIEWTDGSSGSWKDALLVQMTGGPAPASPVTVQQIVDALGNNTAVSGGGAGVLNCITDNIVLQSGTYTDSGKGLGGLIDGAFEGAPQLAGVSAAVDASSLGANALGLLGLNSVLRDAVYDVNGNLTGATIRVYDTAATATADDGATGLLHTYALANVIAGGTLSKQTTTQTS